MALSEAKVRSADHALALPVPMAMPQAARVLPALSVVIAMAVDAVLVVGSFTFAYAIRPSAPETLPAVPIPDSPVVTGSIVAALAIALLAARGMYDVEHPLTWPSRLYGIVSSVSIALVGSVVLGLFLGEPFSRSWSAAGSAVAAGALAIWHTGFGRSYASLSRALIPGRRALVVGANAHGQLAARDLEAAGYQVVGYADNGTDLFDHADHPLLGPIARLDEVVKDFGVEELVIALPFDRRAQLSRILTRGFGRYVRVKYAPDLSDLLPRRFSIRSIGASQYIEFAPVAQVSWVKRCVDMTIAGLGLLVLAPLFALLAVGIRLDSPGPTFYGQVRIGKDGRPFRMLKFRSMAQGADALIAQLLPRNEVSGPMFKIRRDPRVTRVGRFLRRYSLDELPQLVNVLRGDMSLVGPRPPTAGEIAEYEDWQLGRLRAVPGITGLWQVSGRTEVPFHDMVRLDLHYIRNWSFGLDVEILLRTIPAVLSTKGAY